MPAHQLESAWDRAAREWRVWPKLRRGVRVLLFAAVGFALLALVKGWDTVKEELVLFLAMSVGAAIAFEGFAFLWLLVRAPYKQRDEARNEAVEAHAAKSGQDKAVTLLEEQKAHFTGLWNEEKGKVAHLEGQLRERPIVGAAIPVRTFEAERRASFQAAKAAFQDAFHEAQMNFAYGTFEPESWARGWISRVGKLATESIHGDRLNSMSLTLDPDYHESATNFVGDVDWGQIVKNMIADLKSHLGALRETDIRDDFKADYRWQQPPGY